MNLRPHTIMEDVAQDIGFTAANSLVDWFGGGNLYVPAAVDEAHPLHSVLGSSAFAKLVKGYGGTSVWIPLGYERDMDRRDRLIGALFGKGLGAKQIAAVAGMSEAHVQQVRLRLEQAGLLPLIMRRAGIHDDGDSPFTPWAKTRRQTRAKNSG